MREDYFRVEASSTRHTFHSATYNINILPASHATWSEATENAQYHIFLNWEWSNRWTGLQM